MTANTILASTTTRKSWCAWCKGRCGVNVHVEGELLRKVSPDPDSPLGVFGQGCRGIHYRKAAEFFYSELRLKYPLKRKGSRGENKWELISWDRALDEIAERLSDLKSRYGAETLVATAGDAWMNPDEYKTRFLNLFGSPNIVGPSPICMGPRGLVCEAIFGWYPQFSVKPVTECVLSLGSNMAVTRPGVWKNFLAAQKRGAKLIVIDPRKTETTEKADIWLQLKPGTDAVLLMAMIDDIIKSESYNKDFVNKWCHGFDSLKERAREYPVDRAEKICGVPAKQIRNAAEMYATNQPGAIVEGMGIEQQVNSVQIVHARCILAGLTGNMDVEGGEELPGAHSSSGFVTDRQIELLSSLPTEQRRKQIAYDRFRLQSFPGQNLLNKYVGSKAGERGGVHWYKGQGNFPSMIRTILTEDPYPVKAMISSASNPLVSMPNTRLVYRALQKLDLYVVVDLIMNPSAQMADYVLPVASWLEKPLLYSSHGLTDILIGCHAAVSSKTSQYDRRNDFDFWRGLGIRLGQKEYWPWSSLEESYRERMKNMEISFDELCERGWVRDIKPDYLKYKRHGFNTPTGKIEFYSTVFEELGYDPLPYHIPPPASEERDPDQAKEYPLILINGSRSRMYVHSLWREVPSVRKKYPYPIVQMHPETARSLSINDGDWVWLETPMGRIRQRCSYFEGIQTDVVHADGQWWYPELPGNEPFLYGLWLSNVNAILDDNPEICNDIIGSWPQRHALCKVYK